MSAFNPSRENRGFDYEGIARETLSDAPRKLDSLVGTGWRNGPMKSDVYRYLHAAANRGGVTDAHVQAAADALQQGDVRRLKLAVAERKSEKFVQDPGEALGLPFRLADLTTAIQNGKAVVDALPGDGVEQVQPIPLRAAIALAESRSGMSISDLLNREIGPVREFIRGDRKRALQAEFDAGAAESAPDRALADTSYAQWFGENINPFKWMGVGNEALAQSVAGGAANIASGETGVNPDRILADPAMQQQIQSAAALFNIPEQILIMALTGGMAGPAVAKGLGTAMTAGFVAPPLIEAAGIPFSGPAGQAHGLENMGALAQSFNPVQEDPMAAIMGGLNLLGTGFALHGAARRLLPSKGGERVSSGLVDRGTPPDTPPAGGPETPQPDAPGPQGGGGGEPVTEDWLSRSLNDLVQGDAVGATRQGEVPPSAGAQPPAGEGAQRRRLVFKVDPEANAAMRENGLDLLDAEHNLWGGFDEPWVRNLIAEHGAKVDKAKSDIYSQVGESREMGERELLQDPKWSDISRSVKAAGERDPYPRSPQVEPWDPKGEVRTLDDARGLVDTWDELASKDASPAAPVATPARVSLSAMADVPSGQVVTIDPAEVQVHPDVQHRAGADKKTGTTRENKLHGSIFLKDQQGPMTVFVDHDGQVYIGDGHHRLDLANRAERFGIRGLNNSIEDVPRGVDVIVRNAKDGWTIEDVGAEAAMRNLAAGTIEPTDAVAALHHYGLSADDVVKFGNALKPKAIRDIDGLLGLPKEHFETYVRNGDVTPELAAGIGSVDGLTPDEFESALRAAEGVGGREATFEFGAQLARDVKQAGVRSSQAGLFGDTEVKTLPFVERGRIIAALRTSIGSKMAGLLRPINADLLEGERIDKEARRGLAAGLGGSTRQAKGRLDFALQHDQALNDALWRLAEDVQDGKLTPGKAAAEIEAQATASASRNLNDILGGASQADQLGPSGEGGGGVRADTSTGDGVVPDQGGVDETPPYDGPKLFEERARYGQKDEAQPKPLGDYTLAELEALREKQRAHDFGGPGDPKVILGDRYAEWKRIQKDGTWEESQAFDASLTEAQRQALYQDTGPAGMDIHELDRFIQDVGMLEHSSQDGHPAMTPREMGYWLRNKLMNPEKNSEIIRFAVNKIKREGWDPEEVINAGQDAFNLYNPELAKDASGIWERIRQNAKFLREDVAKYGGDEINREADAAEARLKAAPVEKTNLLGEPVEGAPSLDPLRVDDLAKVGARFAMQFGNSGDTRSQMISHLMKAWGATREEAEAAAKQVGIASSRFKPDNKSGSFWSPSELDGQGSLFGFGPVGMVGAGMNDDDQDEGRKWILGGLGLIAAFFAGRGLTRSAWGQKMRARFGKAIEPYLEDGWGIRHTVSQAALEPRLYANQMGGRVKYAIDRLLQAKADWHVRAERDQLAIKDAAAEVFGKKWSKDPAVRRTLGELRDKLESGAELTSQEQAFVEKVQAIHQKFGPMAWEAGIGVADVNEGDKSFLVGQEVRAVVETEDKHRARLTGEVDRIEDDGSIIFTHDGSEYAIEPGMSFERPINELGTKFVPRILRPEFVRDLKRWTALRRQAAEAMLDSGEAKDFKAAYEKVDKMARASALEKGKRPNFFGAVSEFEKIAEQLFERNKQDFSTIEDAKAWLQEAADGLAEDKDLVVFMSSLEKARRIQFAGEHYIQDYAEAFTKYVDRAHKRIALAEAMGNADPRALDMMLKGVRQQDPRHGDYLEKLLVRWFNLGEARGMDRPQYKRLAAAEGSAQSIMKLTGGTTQLAQLSDFVQVLTRVEASSALKGVRDMWNKDKRIDAMVLSGAHRGIMQEMLAEDGRGTMQKVADFVHTVTLIKGLDKSVKTVSMAMGLRDVEALLQRAASKGLSTADRRRALRYGLTEADLAKGPSVLSDEKTLNRIASRVRGDLSYTGAPEDNPLWMSSPGGSMFMRLKKPVYYVTKFLIQDVLSEAKHGNFKPMMKMLTYGTAVGTVVKEWKKLIDQKDPDIEAEFDKDTPLSRQLVLGLAEAADRVGQAGAIGLAKDLTRPYNFDITGRFDVLSAISPTSATDFRSWLGTASEMEFTQPFREVLGLKDARDLDSEDLLKELGRSVPLVRRIKARVSPD